MTNIKKIATSLLLIMAAACLPTVKVLAIGGGKSDDLAIVAVADEPLDAISRLPIGHANKENSNFVIRVKKRLAVGSSDKPNASIDSRDNFTTIGYLYVNNSYELALDASVTNLALSTHDNYKYVWNIFTEESNPTTKEHKYIGFYNPTTDRYLASCAGGETGHSATPNTSGNVGTVASDTSDDLLQHNYFTAHSYADHVIEEVLERVNEGPGYELQSGEHLIELIKDGSGNITGKVIERKVQKHVDHWDHSKHFFHLQSSNYKIKVNSDNSITIVNEGGSTSATEGNTSATEWNNNYASNGYKDEYVFEIVNVMVASKTDVVYEFHATDPKSRATWSFELKGKANAEKKAYTATEIANAFEDGYVGLDGATKHNALRYYKDFVITATSGFNDDGTVKTDAYPHVTVTCNANFPFPMSNDVNMDNCNNDVTFLTLSINADNKNQDGHYVGLEGATFGWGDDAEALRKHNHNDSDKNKFKTDFRRHIYNGLFWIITKSQTETNNPNSVRLHTYGEGLYLMQANVHGATHDGLYEFVPENIQQLAKDDCDHEVLQVLPNIDSEGYGFTLALKTDHTKIVQTSSGKFFGLGTKPANLQMCRMYANEATDLINILVNPRNTKNIGGMQGSDIDFESNKYVADSYLKAIEWRKSNPTTVLPPEEYNWTNEGELEYRMRLQSLHFSMLTSFDYNNINVNKQYRIELYHEGTQDSSNKMLSSFESYMKEGANEIAFAGMQNAELQPSILTDGSAKSASSYWRIKPTEAGVNPETGEEIQVAFYNSNVGAYLKKTTEGVTLEKVTGDLTNDHKFYIKQEGTTDQWVILNDLSTHTGVKKLSVVRGDEVYATSPDAFISEGNIKPTNSFYWSSKYEHGQSIARYSYNTDHHGRWMLTAIETYPMKVSAAGWASICLPYPVTFTADGIKAYYTKSLMKKADNDEGEGYEHNMILAEITASAGKYSIPANVAFLIATENGGAKDISFTVDDANTSSFSMTNTEKDENIFVPVNAQWGDRSYTGAGKVVDNTYYGLGNKKYGIAFYPIVSTSGQCFLPANKAYLNLSQIQTMIGQLTSADAAKLSFMFVLPDEESSTYIDPVTWEETVRPNDGIYYDLNGRRVMNPKKGIYVTSKGKKIVVK